MKYGIFPPFWNLLNSQTQRHRSRARAEMRDSGGEERDLSEGQIGRNQYFTWLGSSTMSQVTTFQSYQNTQDKARPAAEGAGPGGEVCQVPGLDDLASIY